jgi:hypothetical protein
MTSGKRLPPLPPAAQTLEQATLHAEMEGVNRAAFGNLFRATDDDGALLGPYATLLYVPPLVSVSIRFGLHTNVALDSYPNFSTRIPRLVYSALLLYLLTTQLRAPCRPSVR